jgi:hypothetical protein
MTLDADHGMEEMASRCHPFGIVNECEGRIDMARATDPEKRGVEVQRSLSNRSVREGSIR